MKDLSLVCINLWEHPHPNQMGYEIYVKDMGLCAVFHFQFTENLTCSGNEILQVNAKIVLDESKRENNTTANA